MIIKDYFNKIFKKKDNKVKEEIILDVYCKYCKKFLEDNKKYYCIHCKNHYCSEHKTPWRHSLSAKEKCPEDI